MRFMRGVWDALVYARCTPAKRVRVWDALVYARCTPAKRVRAVSDPYPAVSEAYPSESTRIRDRIGRVRIRHVSGYASWRIRAVSGVYRVRIRVRYACDTGTGPKVAYRGNID